MSDFKAKMHKIQFQLGFRPRPCWGSLQCSPEPTSWILGPISKGREGVPSALCGSMPMPRTVSSDAVLNCVQSDAHLAAAAFVVIFTFCCLQCYFSVPRITGAQCDILVYMNLRDENLYICVLLNNRRRFVIFGSSFLQCFDTVGLVIWPVKIVPEITYNVLSGTLNPTTHSVLVCDGFGNSYEIFVLSIFCNSFWHKNSLWQVVVSRANVNRPSVSSATCSAYSYVSDLISAPCELLRYLLV